MPAVSIPYEHGEIRLQINGNVRHEVLAFSPVQHVRDVDAEIRRAMGAPAAGPRLRDLAKPGQKVAIAATDITRKVFEDRIIPLLLEELAAAGVQREDIVIVVGTGTHRANTREEIIEMYGRAVVEQVRIVNHDAYDVSRLVRIGSISRGIPVSLNKEVAEADLRIATGGVDPHLYAGYSGGAKTVAVGCASAETIGATHHISICADPSVRLGVVEGNLFRRFLDEVGRLARVDYVVNVVQTGDGRLVRAFAGRPDEVHAQAVALARRIFETAVPAEADVVVSSPGYPKSRMLYHCGRAFNNILFGERPVVKQGGTIIIPARCQDGYGHEDGPATLRRFHRSGLGWDALIDWVRHEPQTNPGHLFAYRVAHALKRVRIVMTDCLLAAEDLAELGIDKEDTLQGAFDRALAGYKDPFVLIVPYGTVTLPVLRSKGAS